ncbi:hypothetical protein Tco_0603210 [Tanacetum coccineum]
MISLFSVDEICSVCRKACLNSFGEHAIHCKELSSFKYRHDMVGVSFLTYVGVSGYLSRKKRISRGFTVGQAALKAASCKVTKHEKACIKNQHVFVPFAFDTFGFLAPEALELLNRVQRVMHTKGNVWAVYVDEFNAGSSKADDIQGKYTKCTASIKLLLLENYNEIYAVFTTAGNTVNAASGS